MEKTEALVDERGVNEESTSAGWQAAVNAERLRILTRVLPIVIGLTLVFVAAFIGIYLILGRPWQWVWMIFDAVAGAVLFTFAYVLVRRGRLAAGVYLTVLGINISALIPSAVVEGMIAEGVLSAFLRTTGPRSSTTS